MGSSWPSAPSIATRSTGFAIPPRGAISSSRHDDSLLPHLLLSAIAALALLPACPRRPPRRWTPAQPGRSAGIHPPAAARAVHLDARRSARGSGRGTARFFRAAFNLTAVPPDATLYLAGPRSAKIYLNGKLVDQFDSDLTAPGLDFRVFATPLTGLHAAGALRAGRNVIAMEVVRGKGGSKFTTVPSTIQIANGKVIVAQICPPRLGFSPIRPRFYSPTPHGRPRSQPPETGRVQPSTTPRGPRSPPSAPSSWTSICASGTPTPECITGRATRVYRLFCARRHCQLSPSLTSSPDEAPSPTRTCSLTWLRAVHRPSRLAHAAAAGSAEPCARLRPRNGGTPADRLHLCAACHRRHRVRRVGERVAGPSLPRHGSAHTARQRNSLWAQVGLPLRSRALPLRAGRSRSAPSSSTPSSIPSPTAAFRVLRSAAQ